MIALAFRRDAACPRTASEDNGKCFRGGLERSVDWIPHRAISEWISTEGVLDV